MDLQNNNFAHISLIDFSSDENEIFRKKNCYKFLTKGILSKSISNLPPSGSETIRYSPRILNLRSDKQIEHKLI